MKKVFLVVCALCLALNASAQEISAGAEETNATATQAPEEKPSKGAGTLEYRQVDGGFGVGMNLTNYGFVFDLSYLSGGTDGVDMISYNVGFGGNYRVWLGKTAYLDLQAGLAFYSSSLKIEGAKSSTSDTSLGLFATPRLGVKLGENVAITAGYRWDFPEFKFEDLGDKGQFTIGLTYVP